MSSVPRTRPTMYRGVQYRSRLEATWAAFFAMADVRALYEYREDLKGYIPDFEIEWRGSRFLAEVKPAFHFSDFAAAVEKIEASGYRGLALLLGADPVVAYWLAFPALTGPYKGLGPREVAWSGFGASDYEDLWARAQNATQWRAPR